MKEVHENIKKYRKERKMTQEDLARAVGYTDRSIIAKIEKGLVDLPQERIEKFAEVFGVSPEALTGWMPSTIERAEIYADAVAGLLGFRLGGDPAEGLITLWNKGNEVEITMEQWETYRKSLFSYANYLLSQLYEESKK